MNKSIFTDGLDTSLQATEIADLLGKKSVRATFRLHPKAIELLSVLANQLGIKQKSLFDYLMEDEDALNSMAEWQAFETGGNDHRIQKTFVVSQRSLAALDAVSKHSSASRNDLIEWSIQRLLPLFEKERIRQKRREGAVARIDKHFNRGKSLLEEVKAKVGEEDRLYQSLVSVMAAYAKAVADIHELVEKGKRLSDFPLDAVKRDQPKR